ncbi:site-specific DNA-methyltransferase [Microbacterium sp. 2C]|uniref:DNA-methyltransferase n=1 Tax=Microbacterium paulum TaxID=2707006 RepID=UPI0018C2D3F4|nr:site-specific DNA-methyltransferase [Microbacterium paulum]MBG0718370.1 site-specific DNA-methyltransferase [Microbacterium paulum]
MTALPLGDSDFLELPTSVRIARGPEQWRRFDDWADDKSSDALLMEGDSARVLEGLPAESVNMAMTSPPYWNQRQYDGDGIGLEASPAEFVDNLLEVTAQLKRVLAHDGSFWLNIGDTYYRKSLAGVPWRTALRMIDEQGWILRNDVIWSKLKGGMDTSSDRLANTHEMLFHFVKNPKYYYDADAIRSKPRAAKLVNGAVVSATGVSGVRYRRKIELSTELSLEEKVRASSALDGMLSQIARGEFSDFRMVIRGGGQRVTHSDQDRVSGRAKELRDKGFYFLRYHPNGAKPSDVWDIVPEDTQKRDPLHYAAYPVDLCRIPVLATTPPGGIVLDPFAGTGTTLVAARTLGRRGVGIDISSRYIDVAANRLAV